MSTCLAWSLMESHGQRSAALHLVFGANVVFHPVMALIVWKRLLPLRTVELSCLFFAAGICAACMALRFYSPTYSINLNGLYLWIAGSSTSSRSSWPTASRASRSHW